MKARHNIFSCGYMYTAIGGQVAIYGFYDGGNKLRAAGWLPGADI